MRHHMAAGLVVFVAIAGAARADSDWASAGHDLHNSRYQPSERRIGASNVASLTPRWTFTTGGDVSATPFVDEASVLFPDWAGNLFAVDRKTGATRWSHRVADYTGVAGDLARVTPASFGDTIILGNQGDLRSGAFVFAVDKNTGAPRWNTQVDDHPAAVITQSAVVHGSTVYVGVSSQEEFLAGIVPGYTCCSFRGSVVALDAGTGEVLWRTYTVPVGYSGGAVWGSTPVIDSSRGTVYVTTGNNYTVPPDVQACVASAATTEDAASCVPGDDHFDAVLALDQKTGALEWATRALPFDAWIGGCIPFLGDGVSCPSPAGPDYDFGQGPTLYTVEIGAKRHDLVGAGQKSGQYWAFDADTGAVDWVTQVGPGGIAGGLQWGSATDGKRIYAAVSNSSASPWTLPDGTTVTTGFWSALDAATGAILWQTADPGGSSTTAAVSAANGVVYACSMDAVGHMYALDAQSGAILWTFASGGSCNAGAAISHGSVFWGSGYARLDGTSNDKVYRFALAVANDED